MGRANSTTTDPSANFAPHSSSHDRPKKLPSGSSRRLLDTLPVPSPITVTRRFWSARLASPESAPSAEESAEEPPSANESGEQPSGRPTLTQSSTITIAPVTTSSMVPVSVVMPSDS